MQLFETDTTGVLKPLPFTFKSEKGSSYSDRQICVVSRDTFYYADNVWSEKKAIYSCCLSRGQFELRSRYMILLK